MVFNLKWDRPVAKTTCIKNKDRWKIFWMRADFK